MRLRIAFLLLLAACLAPGIAFGRVITVRQDGSGDFTNLTAAVAAAAADDSISMGPGTYAEPSMILLEFPLTIFSTDGRDATVLDGQRARRIFQTSSPGIKLDGLTLANGLGQGGPPTAAGALYCLTRAQVTLEDCTVRGHVAEWGGAVYITDQFQGNGTRLAALGCLFEDSFGIGTAGAVFVANGAAASFVECTFTENRTGLKAGAVHAIRARADFSKCLFRSNRSEDIAGAIFYESSAGTTENCTFVNHTSPGVVAGTIVIQLSAGTNITKNIFSGETAGYALRYFQGIDAHSCNVFCNNRDGSIGEDVPGPGDVLADPQFCDPAALDFRIAATSPAAPGNSACGDLVGAFPVGCATPIGPPSPCEPPPPPAPEPEILAVQDVPDDNGLQVRLRWKRSRHDARGEPVSITGYGIYRREPGAAAAKSAPAAGRPPGTDVAGWDFVGSVPARGDEIYQLVAPTLCDTRSNRPPCWSVFFVSAMTPDPLLYFDSAPDSGYSTDDLPPAPPRNVTAAGTAAGTELRWERDADEEAVAFHVHRGYGDFKMSERTRVAVLSSDETRWTDASGAPGDVSYKITAVDAAGNESTPVHVLGRPRRGSRWVLHANEPNPFNPATTIYYDVPEGGGRLSLRIYDVRGNLVRTLADRFEAEGWRKSVGWDGANDAGERVPSGVYFCRLHAAGAEATQRLVMIE